MLHQNSPLFACTVTLFLYGKSTVLLLFSGGDIRNTPERCPFSFWYGILPGFFRSQAWCGDFQFRGMHQHKKSVRVSGDFSLEQVGIDICGPCTHESNSLDVNTDKNASSKKIEEDKGTQCSEIARCRLPAMFRNM